jgi:hypothetical protein
MSQRSRYGRRSILFWCLVLAGCTKLEDPNQFFGAASDAGSGGVAAGAAGQSGSVGRFWGSYGQLFKAVIQSLISCSPGASTTWVPI